MIIGRCADHIRKRNHDLMPRDVLFLGEIKYTDIFIFDLDCFQIGTAAYIQTAKAITRELQKPQSFMF